MCDAVVLSLLGGWGTLHLPRLSDLWAPPTCDPWTQSTWEPSPLSLSNLSSTSCLPPSLSPPPGQGMEFSEARSQPRGTSLCPVKSQVVHLPGGLTCWGGAATWQGVGLVGCDPCCGQHFGDHCGYNKSHLPASYGEPSGNRLLLVVVGVHFVNRHPPVYG